MNIKKVIMVGIVAMVAVATFAAEIRNVKAFQQYPWSGKVYISYEVSGDVAASAASGTRPKLVVQVTDKATGSTFEATTLSGDTGTGAGLHRVVWDADAQGVTLNSTRVAFTVKYVEEEAASDGALYCVIDLSGGANASTYPVTYMSAPPNGGFNVDEYKTTKLVLRRLDAGTYKMQNLSNVTLTKPFYCGLFEVTQKQYQLVTGENPCSLAGYGKGDTYPVHYVSYNTIRGSSNGAKWPSSSDVDATSFMGKLRARTALDFDLPTEAQWEYACRAGTTTTYYWGDSMNGNYAWFDDNSSYSTHPVGTKTPNAWGLYDMSGNVWEWCLDWYGDLAYGTDPNGSSSGSRRVFRGGSWGPDPADCTSSGRNDYYPSYEYANIGFRLVRTLSNQ